MQVREDTLAMDALAELESTSVSCSFRIANNSKKRMLSMRLKLTLAHTIKLLIAFVLVSWQEPLIEAQIVPPPSNEEVGIDIDRYIGNPLQSAARMTHGVMIKRSILKNGDLDGADDPGAVLEYLQELALVTLGMGNRTPLVQTNSLLFFYVESGFGVLDDGSQRWDVRDGVGILISAGSRHRFTSSGEGPIRMLMLTWPPSQTDAPKSIRVRDVRMLGWNGRSHWSYLGKNLFTPSDGLHPGEILAVVYMPPMSIAEPHAHTSGWQEIWTKLPPDPSFLTLGSEVREMPANTAFLVPPNGKTVHAVLNLTRDRTLSWLFIGRFTVDQLDYPVEPLVSPRPLESVEE